jgi:hypothetical protein
LGRLKLFSAGPIRFGPALNEGIIEAAHLFQTWHESPLSNFSYAFTGSEGQTFSWKYSGPAVRVLLAYPDGNIDGPGLDPDIALVKTGTYVFSIASNTMAENIYGYFKLQFKLKSKQ